MHSFLQMIRHNIDEYAFSVQKHKPYYPHLAQAIQLAGAYLSETKGFDLQRLESVERQINDLWVTYKTARSASMKLAAKEELNRLLETYRPLIYKTMQMIEEEDETAEATSPCAPAKGVILILDE